MKKIVVYIIVVCSIQLFYSVNCRSQEWQWLNPLPQGNVLEKIQFLNEDIGYAVGGASLLKTSDGGDTWVLKNNAAVNEFVSAYFTDAQTGYGISWTGHIYKTTNGANTWDIVVQYDNITFTSVYFVDSDYGFVSGQQGEILKTTDGGKNWVITNLDSPFLGSISFIDKNNGCVIGNNDYIYITSDGGKTWIKNIIAPKTSDTIHIFNSVNFTNINTGYATGEAEVMDYYHGGIIIRRAIVAKTTDGGKNWDLQKFKSDERFFSAYFTDKNNGYLVGYDINGYGVIYKTTDEGKTWNRKYSQTNNYNSRNWLVSVNFKDDLTGIAVGAGGIIVKTTDGGETWAPDNNYGRTQQSFYSAYFINKNTGYVVGGNGYDLNKFDGLIWKTTDGGKTWKENTAPNFLHSVYFVDSLTGYAVGNYGTIVKTVDGGENWTVPLIDSTEVDSTYYLYDVFFTDKNTGYISGRTYAGWENGVIFKTIDGGKTWNKVYISSDEGEVFSVCFTNKDNGHAVYNDYFHNSGAILNSTDGGETWTEDNWGDKYCFAQVCFTDTNTGFVLGGEIISDTETDDIILKSRDGGKSWNKIDIGALGLGKMFFVDSLIGYAISWDRIYKTYDGGKTWKENQGYTLTSTLHSIYFTDANTGYCVGGPGGTILKTTVGGTSGVSDTGRNEDKSEIKIYPNPAKEKLTINYKLLTPSKISIDVYDMLGNRVGLLENTYKEIGKYTIKYNCQNLKRGIYIIKASVNNRILENKKFIKL